MASYTVIWSPSARLSYYQILEYLEERWPIKVLENFINRTAEVLNLICKNPLLYPFSKESEIHKCVVVKQVSLFYRIKETSVELLIFWDNRQSITKLIL